MKKFLIMLIRLRVVRIAAIACGCKPQVLWTSGVRVPHHPPSFCKAKMKVKKSKSGKENFIVTNFAWVAQLVRARLW